MRKLLFIDDSRAILTALNAYFANDGYQVTTADNGEAGTRLFQEEQQDVVITDIIMPGQEGLETIQNLRKLSAHVPIIAMSGASAVRGMNYLKMARLMGADHSIQKPFKMKELALLIDQCLA